MKIIVCVKQVLAADRIKFDPRTYTMVRTADNSYINPNDLFALQMAVHLKERYGGRITAVTMGPPISEEVLREAMALGVDRGVLLSDRRFAGADTLATSYVLGMGIRKLGDFDLVLCGTVSTDSDTGQVGPQLAEEMHLPQVTGVEKIEKQGSTLRLERTSDGFREVMEVTPPVLVTVSRRAAPLRLPGLLDIQDAYGGRTFDCYTLEDLEAEENKVGLNGSGIWVTELAQVPKQKSCQFIKGDPRHQVQTLMEKLREKNLID
ncbi:MAG: electron transfer flavoprotein subunit beta/FixA family protein [Desulfobacterales bacterium]|nr:electron transfer flavoprotein subunit beta/FixA family protein [Desulfobacterales bacterium]